MSDQLTEDQIEEQIKEAEKLEYLHFFDDLEEPDPIPMNDEKMDLLESAWGIIANAGGGDWTLQTDDWQRAAEKWREKYHSLPEMKEPKSDKAEMACLIN